MSAKGLTVTIVTPNGAPFKTYKDPNEDEIPSPDLTTTYILATPNENNDEVHAEEFEIKVKAEEWLHFPSGIGYQFMLYIRDDQLMQTCWVDRTRREGRFSSQILKEADGTWGRRRFVFRGLKISENQGLNKLPAELESSIGSLKLVVKPVICPHIEHPNQNMLYTRVNTAAEDLRDASDEETGILGMTINEKALKGKAARHQAALGQSTPSLEPGVAPAYSYDSDVPYHTFTFLYRTKPILQSLGIIPTTPAPPNPETREATARWVGQQQAMRSRTERARSVETLMDWPPKIKEEPGVDGEDLTLGASAGNLANGTIGAAGRKRKAVWYEFSEEKRYKDDDGELEEIPPPKKPTPTFVDLVDSDEEEERKDRGEERKEERKEKREEQGEEQGGQEETRLVGSRDETRGYVQPSPMNPVHFQRFMNSVSSALETTRGAN